MTNSAHVVILKAFCIHLFTHLFLVILQIQMWLTLFCKSFFFIREAKLILPSSLLDSTFSIWARLDIKTLRDLNENSVLYLILRDLSDSATAKFKQVIPSALSPMPCLRLPEDSFHTLGPSQFEIITVTVCLQSRPWKGRSAPTSKDGWACHTVSQAQRCTAEAINFSSPSAAWRRSSECLALERH